MTAFRDRQSAGQLLAQKLKPYQDEKPVILALPRGGLPVAFEVAKALKAPLDILIIRKIGAPANPELAVGAMAEDGSYELNEDDIQMLGIPRSQIMKVIDEERKELARRIDLYRRQADPVPVEGKTVIVIDDGLATGSTAHAAVHLLKSKGVKRVVLALPVCARESAHRLSKEADEVVCLAIPEPFYAVGAWYGWFPQISDQQVLDYLAKARLLQATHQENGLPIECRQLTLTGDLSLPPHCEDLVIFAHGSGSSRKSPRNRYVAEVLNENGIGTLLFDLLTEEESMHRSNVFDIDLLAERLTETFQWVKRQNWGRPLNIAFFGASTGAAAALTAAAELGPEVVAVVSRGGRPDLASGLRHVQAHALLIVGGYDRSVLDLNRQAAESLAHVEISIIPETGHLFEEPGKLEQVAEQATAWLSNQFARARGIHAA